MISQKHRFLIAAVVGAVAIPGLALAVPAERNISAALFSMLFAAMLAGAGWFATILYADDRIGEAVDRADEHFDLLEEVRAAILAACESDDPVRTMRELAQTGPLVPLFGSLDVDVITGETVEVA